MLDAYTVRKAIPRIVIAVIGINLSIYLCVLLIDVTNIFGNGLGSIITGPFVGDGIKIGSQNFSGNPVTQGVLGVIFATLIASVVAGPGVLALIGSIFPLILIVLLVALAVIFTLVIRQGLLLFLTVISPVAIALSILPGTEKYFKKWFDLFITTLMVYPIIAVLFAVSTAMTAILLGDANAGQGADQTIKLIAGIIVIYAPLVLIPFAFKLAGGAISAVMNAAQGVTERKRRGLVEGRAKGLAESKAKNLEGIATGTRFKGGTANNWRGRLNRGLQSTSIVTSGGAGVNPLKARSRMQAEKSAREYTEAQKTKEDSVGKSILVNDDLMKAVLAGDRTEESARQYLVEQGQSGRMLEQNVAAIRQARRNVGARSLEIASAAALPGTKTAFTGEHGDVEMLETAMKAANGDKTLQGLIYNEQRQNAMAASRFDLGGYGFGAGLKAMDQMEVAMASGDQTRIARARADASADIQEDALTHLSGGQIMGGHGYSVGRMMNAANTKIDKAAEKYNEAINNTRNIQDPQERSRLTAESEREFKQALALSANLIDVAGSVGSANAKEAADSHQSHTYTRPDGKVVRISDAVQEMRNDPVFGQMRREYAQSGPLTEAERLRIEQSGGIDPTQGGPKDPTKTY